MASICTFYLTRSSSRRIYLQSTRSGSVEGTTPTRPTNQLIVLTVIMIMIMLTLISKFLPLKKVEGKGMIDFIYYGDRQLRVTTVCMPNK